MANTNKSKIAAGLLAIFLGDFGIHKFYMGKVGKGLLYLLFFWTGIPAFIGLIEGIIYLCDSDEKFASRVAFRHQQNQPTETIHRIEIVNPQPQYQPQPQPQATPVQTESQEGKATDAEPKENQDNSREA